MAHLHEKQKIYQVGLVIRMINIQLNFYRNFLPRKYLTNFGKTKEMLFQLKWSTDKVAAPVERAVANSNYFSILQHIRGF